MKITLEKLRQYIELPVEVDETVELMEDVGLEVKNVTQTSAITVLTLELLANRGDHHSYSGIARELNGRLGLKLPKIKLTALELKSNSDPIANIETKYCYNYAVMPFSQHGENHNTLSPVDIEALEQFGYNLVCPSVDITNLVSLELGQPLHAFDAEKIVGMITVRLSEEGEKAWPLFFELPITLPAGTMVIADESKILAIAGVIGCEESKSTIESKNILIESATFDPVKVRLSAKSLGLSTSASTRFERGSDPKAITTALLRAAYLLEKNGWEQNKKPTIIENWDKKNLKIYLSKNELKKFLGIEMQNIQIINHLKRYGFIIDDNDASDSLIVEVPTHRIWDISIKEDILEELAKSIGYNKFPATLPITRGKELNEHLKIKSNIEEILIARGFYEVFTDGFYSVSHKTTMPKNSSPDSKLHLSVINAEDKGYSLMKNNAVIQMVELVKVNQNVKNMNIRAFEWATIFSPDTRLDNSTKETKILCGISSCFEKDTIWKPNIELINFYNLRGIVEQILSVLGIQYSFSRKYNSPKPIASEFLHPNKRLYIISNNLCIGVIGEVHPELAEGWKIKRERAYYFEVHDTAFNITPKDYLYTPPSNNFPIHRDISLHIPQKIDSSDILEAVMDSNLPVVDAQVLDIFKLDDNPMISLTIRLTLSGQLTRNQANNTSKDIIELILVTFTDSGIEIA